MMDMGALFGMGASMLGEQAAGKLSAQQQRILEQMYGDLRDIPLPELERIIADELGPSAMEGVYSDPEQREQQLEVMNELRDIFSNGGFNVEDQAALAEALNRSNVQGSAQRHALAGEFAQRGQLGAGARLALGNMDAQGAANRSSQAGLDVAAQGQRRRMDALGRYGSMASGLRSQDFGEASSRASAKDAADKWNASAREKANYYNAGLGQQQFGNRMAKATGQQNAGTNLAGFFGNESQGVRNQYANYGQAAGAAAKGFNFSGGGGSRTVNADDPNDVFANGVDYGESSVDEWDNPYGGY
jgi:hypothetical protein